MGTDALTAANEAERTVLAAMMSSPEAVWEVLDVLQPGDFSAPRHELIARAVVALAQEGKPTTQIAVSDELTRAGLLRQAGGESYVWGLDTVTAANAGYYAELVRDNAVVSRVKDAGKRILELAEGGVDAAKLVEQAREAVDHAAARTGGQTRAVGDTLGEVLDAMGSPDRRYVPTPWGELNSFISGFHPGRMYVVGARPASGKTMMALQAAVKLAMHGRVSFASLEMEEPDLQRRLLAQFAGVNLTALEHAALTQTEWERIAEARRRIQALPLFVDARPEQTITQVKAQARTVSRRGKLAGVVLDYIGLVQTPDDRRGRWEHVGAISRACKVMAKELQVPVIVLAQLNRESVAGGKQRLPTLAELRESGSIEQDADVVLLLQRRQDDEGRDMPLLDVVVGKNRHGRTGRFTLNWEGEYARVVSVPVHSAPPEPPRDTRQRLDVDG